MPALPGTGVRQVIVAYSKRQLRAGLSDLLPDDRGKQRAGRMPALPGTGFRQVIVAYSERQLEAGLNDLLPGDRENQKSRQDAGATRNRISSSDRGLKQTSIESGVERSVAGRSRKSKEPAGCRRYQEQDFVK
jgi:hypothetical protein